MLAADTMNQHALTDALRTHKTLGALRGLASDTEAVLYAQAFAALQQREFGRALYLFSFLVLHQHPNSDYWQGLGHAQSGLGNAAAGAMSLLVGYELRPSGSLALEIAKNFNQCGLTDLACHYAQCAAVVAKDEDESAVHSAAELLHRTLTETPEVT